MPTSWSSPSVQGHSLGGSLATLLQIMYRRRNVLPLHAVTPVYTFGAPAIFCEAGAGSDSWKEANK